MEKWRQNSTHAISQHLAELCGQFQALIFGLEEEMMVFIGHEA
jgi:hypothetical protein